MGIALAELAVQEPPARSSPLGAKQQIVRKVDARSLYLRIFIGKPARVETRPAAYFH
jgi:hypothetical protein